MQQLKRSFFRLKTLKKALLFLKNFRKIFTKIDFWRFPHPAPLLEEVTKNNKM